MSEDLLRRKFEHRFNLLDTDHDGYITEADLTALGDRLIAHLQEPPTSPKSRSVADSRTHYWRCLSRLAAPDADGRVSKDAFVAGLAASADSPRVREMVHPSIKADLALADRDDDGVVDIDEFTTLYTAIGVPTGQARDIFRVLDRNGDGSLDLDEWLEAADEFFTATDSTAPGNHILGRV
ncbi:EF-hand domain-containing protein [Streptomyces luteolus]|uniref:EF-hand domain-containing protein n=1 Tax=Streptomyces luteolus TaxID=3043615 RepID=A0ABT6SPE7_9ACTN|nr:EF-hand domain-containing protein [Streptomyces sp. B-S-A12]MDI3417476.1 EF-hand domain-containing protein [Streptomyces sp. B-S-A12]